MQIFPAAWAGMLSLCMWCLWFLSIIWVNHSHGISGPENFGQKLPAQKWKSSFFSASQTLSAVVCPCKCAGSLSMISVNHLLGIPHLGPWSGITNARMKIIFHPVLCLCFYPQSNAEQRGRHGLMVKAAGWQLGDRGSISSLDKNLWPLILP